MSDPTRKRRWLRFSLRTLLVMVALVSVPFGWAAHQLNWIRQRHEFLEMVSHKNAAYYPRNNLMLHGWYAWDIPLEENNRQAPWSLRVFGELSEISIALIYKPFEDQYDEGLATIWREVALAQKLFPEADVYPVCVDAYDQSAHSVRHVDQSFSQTITWTSSWIAPR